MGTLYILASPIGNMQDLSFRAVQTLKNADIIYCEDTRVSKNLLNHYNIERKVLRSLNARTEKAKINELLRELKSGKQVVYMSDAGTPGISDPGANLVHSARKAGFSVVPIPGPSAFVAALSASGIFAHHFVFYGFLPQKKGRQSLLKQIAKDSKVSVFYESKHRIMKFLREFQEYAPSKQICLARELTKIHEEFLYGTAQELIDTLEQNPQKQKGEFVVIMYDKQ